MLLMTCVYLFYFSILISASVVLFSDKMTSPLSLADFLSTVGLKDAEVMILPSINATASAGSSSAPMLSSTTVGVVGGQATPQTEKTKDPDPKLKN